MGPKAMVLKVSHLCNHKRKESFVLSLVFGLLCLILLTGHCEAGSGSSSSNSSISIGSSKRDRLVFFLESPDPVQSLLDEMSLNGLNSGSGF